MSEPLNELKDADFNLKLIQLWLENNPGKTEQDLLKVLEDINNSFIRSGKWLDSELERIKKYTASGD